MISDRGTTPRQVGRRFTPVDAAMVHLVRLVVDEAWTAASAGAALSRQIPDMAVLRRAQARVRRALAEGVTPVGQRAAATLEVALAIGATPATSGGCHGR
jgi:hypothetical protein